MKSTVQSKNCSTVPLHDRKNGISILYHVIVNSQLNRDNLTRCYIRTNRRTSGYCDLNDKVMRIDQIARDSGPLFVGGDKMGGTFTDNNDGKAVTIIKQK